MKFSTPVDLPDCPLKLTPQSSVMLIGSCFTEHIGAHLAQGMAARRLSINPNGVLYNPGSLYQSLKLLLAPFQDTPPQLAFKAADGLWHHWLYSTRFTAPTLRELNELLQAKWTEAKAVFDRMDVLFVTLSTDHAYFLTEGEPNDMPVANCHKQPGRMFREEVLHPSTLCALWDSLLDELKAKRPELKVVFTLSPYRYAKYGMHENALSKARLLMLIDHLCRHHEQACYFPAYEIVMDELRDYRFYEADMLHPSAQATDYVWERFTDWAFTDEMREYTRDRMILTRDLNHRPLHTESEEYAKFRLKTEERRRLFETKWGEPF